jgi:sec-independent protein translocase protein TatA
MFRNPTADALVILLVVLLIFGPKRLPSLGRSLGQGLREFKDSITGDKGDEERRELTEASATPVAPPSTATHVDAQPAAGAGERSTERPS